ncbi:UvrD-helicase domain-containing protein [Fastidiosibacter lacustris]|uniref:UvrD-helicase domain-containing protein n=1 Tax=Fastidiosibacter lacustris TaxID=2056695 RepID=UPI000E354EE4|nr:UvrD-helicase domain-containing protein [Fastidiosibacter lacustris]
MTPSDAHARQQALNPKQSFIVQAPAGSGKTETLTQRYLNLLAHVQNAPEEIIALTFTNKAANEMHHRIYQALVNANGGKPPCEPHKHLTFDLAQKALQQNQLKNWHLLENPKRLRITTIDAFCQYLSRHLIYESDEAFSADVTEDANSLYEQAIDALIHDTTNNSPWQDSLYRILLHLDNDIERLKSLLSSMLAKREQWLPIVIQLQLFKNNSSITKQEIESGFCALFNSLSTQAYTVLKLDEYEDKFIKILHFCHPELSSQRLSFTSNNVEIWQYLTSLIFTNNNEFRKSFTAKQKLPAKDPNAKSHTNWLMEYISLFSEKEKEQITAIIGELRLFSSLCFSSSEWEILSAMTAIAIHSVQYLKLIFSQTAKMDFNEVSLQALSALGSENTPTNLALYLDHQIQHLLIDEFQDTSILQFTLLQMLTLEWQPNDGKTLFVVGDPMQSIYRFRQAEVNLFLQVKDNGINQIKPKYLQLSCNFRSQKSIVDWVNSTFAQIFPKINDLNFGGIAYAPSNTLSDKVNPNTFTQSYFQTADEEAIHIANAIKSYQKINPKHNIAILVRSRSHLKSIVPTLKTHGLAIIENEIETLYQQAIILDLLCLSCILSNPQHEIYWISLLQSNLFGFTLHELNEIKHIQIIGSEESNFIQQLTQYLASNKQYAHQQKAAYFIEWIQHEGFMGNKAPLTKRLTILWQKVDGPIIHPQPTLYDNYLDILDKHLSIDRTIICDTTRLIEALKTTYASAPPTANIHIMTIHKSKGLEFDFVILPQLEKATKADDSQLFLYETTKLDDQRTHLLLSPIKHSWDDTAPALYKVIQNMQKKRASYELQRLLYVAITRAKYKVLLSAVVDTTDQENIRIQKNSFLSLLHPLALDWNFMLNDPQLNQVDETKNQNQFYKPIQQVKNYTILPLSQNQACNALDNANLNNKNPLNHPGFSEFVLSDERRIGSVLHALFNYLCYFPQQDWQPYFEVATHEYGLKSDLKKKAYIQAHTAIQNTKQHYSWIFSATGFSEQIMLSLRFNKPQKRIADRIIATKDGYQIIDYKFTTPVIGEALDAFLITQRKLYYKQLLIYQRQLAKYFQLDRKKIVLYLYFPLIPNLFKCSRW